MIVGTAGHIDHGKTALVRALTGVDTDRLPEEKRRGITIELGFAPLVIPGLGTVGVVDVPGHEAFIRTMVAGATGIDLGLLVIAADEGVMPQTREHLAILSLLDVRAGIIALTKCDLAEPDWVELVKDDLRALVEGSVLAGAPIMEASAKDGRGVEALKVAIGDALRGVQTRSCDDLFRLPVDRAFSVKGTGTVVTGTTWTGEVATGTEVRLYPADRPVRVRGIQSHGATLDKVGPGERTALALAGVEVGEVPRGSVLVGGSGWQPTTRFHAEVTLVPDAGAYRPREWLRLHVGTAEVAARVVPIARGEDAPTLLARVVTESPVVLRAGDRFILRRSQPLATVGGGRVTDPAPTRRRARPTATWIEDPAARLQEAVREVGAAGLELSSVPVRIGIPPADVRSARAAASDLGEVGGRLYLQSLLDRVAERVAGHVLAWHVSHPSEEGLPPARLRADLPEFGALVDHAVERLATLGRVEVVSGVVRQLGWAPRWSGEELEGMRWLAGRLEGAGMEPPAVAELRAERGGHDVLPWLRQLEREGKVVPVEPDRFYAAGPLATGLGALRRAMADGSVHSPAQLREVLGVSRKFLMPLLEYCDRRRITERRGDGRVLLAPVESSGT